ncbi:disease resistance protein At4g27190-like [Punica granatum]|uniref:Disease resistance protein At4g27190-like n=1 Tax=Punica granatum TaxID=22663 RepID=A0A6P8BYM6_PUNGR|nr:disease resistance protein At4g27190-like [Punica granatum]XP_031374299.1 disease resistance protein At4g27190-like [Punica granatum]
MGKPKHSCWDYVTSIPNPGNPHKRRWQCNYCNKDYAGGASRIKVHLGLATGQGIEVCQKVKEGQMSQVPENGTSSATENAEAAGFSSSGFIFNQDSQSTPLQASPSGIQGPVMSIEAEMDLPVYSPESDPSIWDLSTLEATMKEFAAAIDSQLHVDPANTVLQQNNGQYVPSSFQVSPGQALEQQDMSASATICELGVNIDGENSRVQSGLLPNSLDLPEECHHTDAMQVDQNPRSERDQGMCAVFPQPSTELPHDRGDSGGDAILVTELVGQEFKRRVNEIWDYVRKDDVLRIGIYGMGGVGKTTIVKHLYNKVCASAAFEDVFWVTASRDCSIHELQNKIAKALKVLDHFKDVDEVMRPTLLFNYLSKKRKILLILDDVWQHFELVDIGIPVKRDGVQLVLTTRYLDVCQKMLCQPNIGVRPLSDEEAWTLFARTLGSDVVSPRQEPIAKNIVKECGGLPLAIVVMAGSMRGVDSDHGWEDALEKLKQPETLQEDMAAGVFPILQHSYNHLDAKKQQFLLRFALYPEDAAVLREELIEFYIDEGVICGDSRWKMYNEGHRILDELDKASLLESRNVPGSRGTMVRMHDVLRDMALYIMHANGPCMVRAGLSLKDVPDEDEWIPNLHKVSLMKNEIAVIPSISPYCPQLSTLLISNCSSLCEISGCFFERLQGLKVINLSSCSIREVPRSITELEKLNALILRQCDQLSLLPSLAKLTSLRKLDLRGCRGIKVVPDGLEMLAYLMYLDITGTGIERIQDGVIGKLLKLQVLLMGWIEVKGEEVGKLKKLEVLQCRFRNANELNKYTQAQHVTILKSYILLIGARTEGFYWNNRTAKMLNFHGYNLTWIWNMKVIILGEGHYAGKTFDIPIDVKRLWIEGDSGARDISSSTRSEVLEELHICMQKLDKLSALQAGAGVGVGDNKIRNLNFLSSPPGGHCFDPKKLVVQDCPKLKHLLVPERNCGLHLKKLEELRILECRELESIIGAEAAAEALSSTSPLPPDAFSQLRSIYIRQCSEMKNVVGLEWLPLLHNLQSISIDCASNMEEIIAMPSVSPPPAPPLPVATSTLQLPLLTKISVWQCHKMKKVLTLELFMLLPNLQEISVEICQQMKEVIGGQESEDGPTASSSRDIYRPPSTSRRLLRLNLYDLQELDSICRWTPIRDFIQVLVIFCCPKLKRIPMLDEFPHYLPPSLERVVAYPYEWWEALEWVHPEAKLALEPSVVIGTGYWMSEISVREWRERHHGETGQVSHII